MVRLPVRAQDVPGAIARAYHEAVAGRGPALVVVPMGDWEEPADELAAGWPERTVRAASVAPEEVGELADMIDRARRRPWWWAREPTAARAGSR